MVENIKKVRTAVIGLGKMGLLHACILNVLPNVEVVAICDKSFMLRKFFQKVFRRVQFADDVADLAGLDLDAVYITTPIPSHFAVANSVFANGVAGNVFVEKTLASSYAEATKMIELAHHSKGTNMVGYMKRFGVTFVKAREILSQGMLGELRSFDAYAYSSDFAVTDRKSKISGSRGGVLGDLGSHVIDLALWFFGDLELTAGTLRSLTGSGSEDEANFKVKGLKDLEGRFNISWCKAEYRMPEFGLVVQGTKGVLKVNDDEVHLDSGQGQSKVLFRQDLGDNVDFLLGDPEYCREDECFVKSILRGERIEPDFLTASKVDYLIDEVKKKTAI